MQHDSFVVEVLSVRQIALAAFEIGISLSEYILSLPTQPRAKRIAPVATDYLHMATESFWISSFLSLQ
jgi:hypothetical protein